MAAVSDVAVRKISTRNPLCQQLPYCLALTILLVLSSFSCKPLNGPSNDEVLSQDRSRDIQYAEDTTASVTEQLIVRGDSLSGMIEDGEEVTLLLGYYDSHDVLRGDIAVYKYADDKAPMIKIVKGLPGDRFELRNESGVLRIAVNDKILSNSRNERYELSENGYQMLSLYIKDYDGVIPANTYLLLGNKAAGATGSTRFGLVDKKGILGKVLEP